MKFHWSRRDFLKNTTAAAVLAAAEQTFGAMPSTLQKRRLGKTGEMVSCIGFGAGSRYCSIPDEDAAQALLDARLIAALTTLTPRDLTRGGRWSD